MMKFSGKEIPGSLFKLARDRMLATVTFTPDDIRMHLLSGGRQALCEVSPIEKNQWIIANRVYQSARIALVKAGDIAQLKRGVWAKASFLAA